MNRTHKWRYKRLEMETERDVFANSLLDISEKIVKIHSDMSNGILTRSVSLDQQMEDPLDKIDEMMNILKERKTFL